MISSFGSSEVVFYPDWEKLGAFMGLRVTEGTQSSFIKCKTCQNTTTKPVVFYDIFTTYKMFGGHIHHSLEEALDSVFNPEELAGDNKYMCEECGSKQEAWKGLRIDHLPEYVTLYVNRFEIDYETFQRKKVKGRMAFAEVLNFKKYVNPNNTKTTEEGTTLGALVVCGFTGSS